MFAFGKRAKAARHKQRQRERERETQTNKQTKRGTHVFSIFIFWQLLLLRGGRFVVVCFEEKLEEMLPKSNLGKAANATNDASSSFFFFFFFFERLSREQRENGRRNDDVVASGNGCCVGVVSDD